MKLRDVVIIPAVLHGRCVLRGLPATQCLETLRFMSFVSRVEASGLFCMGGHPGATQEPPRNHPVARITQGSPRSHPRATRKPLRSFLGFTKEPGTAMSHSGTTQEQHLHSNLMYLNFSIPYHEIEFKFKSLFRCARTQYIIM